MFPTLKPLLCISLLFPIISASITANTIITSISRIEHANNAFRQHIQAYTGAPNQSQAVFYSDLAALTNTTKDAITAAHAITHPFNAADSCRIVDFYCETLGKDIPLTNAVLRRKVMVFRKLGEAKEIAGAQKGFQRGLDGFAAAAGKWLSAERERFEMVARRIHGVLQEGIDVYGG